MKLEEQVRLFSFSRSRNEVPRVRCVLSNSAHPRSEPMLPAAEPMPCSCWSLCLSLLVSAYHGLPSLHLFILSFNGVTLIFRMQTFSVYILMGLNICTYPEKKIFPRSHPADCLSSLEVGHSITVSLKEA